MENTTKIIKGGATLPDFVRKNNRISGQSGIPARNRYALSSNTLKEVYNFYRNILNMASTKPDGFYEAIQRSGHLLKMRKDHRLIGEWDLLFFRIKQVPGEIHFYLKKFEEVMEAFEKLPSFSDSSSDSFSFSDSLNYNFKGVKK